MEYLEIQSRCVKINTGVVFNYEIGIYFWGFGFSLQLLFKVIEYAENHNNCAAEREFGVTEKMVREWRKKKSELGGARKSAKRLRLTFTVPYKAMEDKLHEWVLECR